MLLPGEIMGEKVVSHLHLGGIRLILTLHGRKGRRQNRECPVETWDEMKSLMRRHLVPSHYY